MREIKFRGQTGTTKDKKWVYGHYYRVKSFFNDNEGHYISTIRSDHLQDYNIDENTLGQYTGLKDKNGKEIYGGDILSYGKIKGPVKYGEYMQSKCDEYDCPHHGYYIDCKWENYCENTGIDLYEMHEECEVVGNIYDNPELLEKGE